MVGTPESARPGDDVRPIRVAQPAPFAALMRPSLIHLAWLQAVFAMVGSLYFSEVLHFTPCILCWYQRIAMYPLVAILTVGLLLRDSRLRFYVLPLSLIGLTTSLYHNLLYYGIIPESSAPCSVGAPCTTRYIEWLGFISIPLLALVAFTVISVSLFLHLPDEGTVPE